MRNFVDVLGDARIYAEEGFQEGSPALEILQSDVLSNGKINLEFNAYLGVLKKQNRNWTVVQTGGKLSSWTDENGGDEIDWEAFDAWAQEVCQENL